MAKILEKSDSVKTYIVSGVEDTAGSELEKKQEQGQGATENKTKARALTKRLSTVVNQMSSSTLTSAVQWRRLWQPPRLKRSLIMACSTLLFIFMLINIVQAEDFKKLDEAIPGAFVAELAPVFDFDGDGCLPSAGISRSGQQNDGLKLRDCRSVNFLDTSNTLHRYACTSQSGSTYCGHFYALYFEEDSAGLGGHIHDWEYAAIWTKNGVITHGSVSGHGKLKTKAESDLPFENGHLKVVYHQHGRTTHALRFAKRNEKADKENPYGKFVTPTLASWYSLFGDGVDNVTMRNMLNSFDYGSANLPIKDSNFFSELNEFKPQDYPIFAKGMEYDTDRWGSDYRSFNLSQPNPEICQETCAREGACRAWTYVKPGIQGTDARCWLKNSMPASVPNSCCTSGIKVDKQFTDRFSEEYPSSQICPAGYVVTGIICFGRYCDNKQLECSAIPGMVLSGLVEDTPYFSEEGTNFYKNDGEAIVGMSCSGRYCDNVSLMTRKAQGTGGVWTTSFSEEAGYGYCDGGYVAGVRCTGRYCDNLSLYCKE